MIVTIQKISRADTAGTGPVSKSGGEVHGASGIQQAFGSHSLKLITQLDGLSLCFFFDVSFLPSLMIWMIPIPLAKFKCMLNQWPNHQPFSGTSRWFFSPAFTLRSSTRTAAWVPVGHGPPSWLSVGDGPMAPMAIHAWPVFRWRSGPNEQNQAAGEAKKRAFMVYINV